MIVLGQTDHYNKRDKLVLDISGLRIASLVLMEKFQMPDKHLKSPILTDISSDQQTVKITNSKINDAIEKDAIKNPENNSSDNRSQEREEEGWIVFDNMKIFGNVPRNQYQIDIVLHMNGFNTIGSFFFEHECRSTSLNPNFSGCSWHPNGNLVVVVAHGIAHLFALKWINKHNKSEISMLEAIQNAHNRIEESLPSQNISVEFQFIRQLEGIVSAVHSSSMNIYFALTDGTFTRWNWGVTLRGKVTPTSQRAVYRVWNAALFLHNVVTSESDCEDESDAINHSSHTVISLRWSDRMQCLIALFSDGSITFLADSLSTKSTPRANTSVSHEFQCISSPRIHFVSIVAYSNHHSPRHTRSHPPQIQTNYNSWSAAQYGDPAVYEKPYHASWFRNSLYTTEYDVMNNIDFQKYKDAKSVLTGHYEEEMSRIIHMDIIDYEASALRSNLTSSWLITLITTRHIPSANEDLKSGAELDVGEGEEGSRTETYSILLHQIEVRKESTGPSIRLNCIQSKNLMMKPIHPINSEAGESNPTFKIIHIGNASIPYILLQLEGKITCRPLHSLECQIFTINIPTSNILPDTLQTNKRLHASYRQRISLSTARGALIITTINPTPDQHHPVQVVSNIFVIPILSSIESPRGDNKKGILMDFSEGKVFEAIPRGSNDYNPSMVNHQNESGNDPSTFDSSYPLPFQHLKLPTLLQFELLSYNTSMLKDFSSYKSRTNMEMFINSGMLFGSSLQTKQSNVLDYSKLLQLYSNSDISDFNQSTEADQFDNALMTGNSDSTDTPMEYFAFICGGSWMVDGIQSLSQVKMGQGFLLWVYNKTTKKWRSTVMALGGKDSVARIIRDVPTVHYKAIQRPLPSDKSNCGLFSNGEFTPKRRSQSLDDDSNDSPVTNKLPQSRELSTTPTKIKDDVSMKSPDANYMYQTINKTASLDSATYSRSEDHHQLPQYQSPDGAKKNMSSYRSLLSPRYQNLSERKVLPAAQIFQSELRHYQSLSFSSRITSTSNLAGPLSAAIDLVWCQDHTIALLSQRRSVFCVEFISREATKTTRMLGHPHPAIHRVLLLPPGYAPQTIQVLQIKRPTESHPKTNHEFKEEEEEQIFYDKSVDSFPSQKRNFIAFPSELEEYYIVMVGNGKTFIAFHLTVQFYSNVQDTDNIVNRTRHSVREYVVVELWNVAVNEFLECYNNENMLQQQAINDVDIDPSHRDQNLSIIYPISNEKLFLQRSPINDEQQKFFESYYNCSKGILPSNVKGDENSLQVPYVTLLILDFVGKVFHFDPILRKVTLLDQGPVLQIEMINTNELLGVDTTALQPIDENQSQSIISTNDHHIQSSQPLPQNLVWNDSFLFLRINPVDLAPSNTTMTSYHASDYQSKMWVSMYGIDPTTAKAGALSMYLPIRSLANHQQHYTTWNHSILTIHQDAPMSLLTSPTIPASRLQSFDQMGSNLKFSEIDLLFEIFESVHQLYYKLLLQDLENRQLLHHFQNKSSQKERKPRSRLESNIKLPKTLRINPKDTNRINTEQNFIMSFYHLHTLIVLLMRIFLHQYRSGSVRNIFTTSTIIRNFELKLKYLSEEKKFNNRDLAFVSYSSLLFQMDSALYYEVLSRLGRKLEPSHSAKLFPSLLLPYHHGNYIHSSPWFERQEAKRNEATHGSVPSHKFDILVTQNKTLVHLFECAISEGRIDHASRFLTLACETLGASGSHISTITSLVLTWELFSHALQKMAFKVALECLNFCCRLEAILYQHCHSVVPSSDKKIFVMDDHYKSRLIDEVKLHILQFRNLFANSNFNSNSNLISNENGTSVRSESIPNSIREDSLVVPWPNLQNLIIQNSLMLPYYFGEGFLWFISNAFVRPLLPSPALNDVYNVNHPFRRQMPNLALNSNLNNVTGSGKASQSLFVSSILPTHQYTALDSLVKGHGLSSVTDMLCCNLPDDAKSDDPPNGIMSSQSKLGSPSMSATVSLIVLMMKDMIRHNSYYTLLCFTRSIKKSTSLLHILRDQIVSNYRESAHMTATRSDGEITLKQMVNRLYYVFRMNKIVAQNDPDALRDKLNERITFQYLRRMVSSEQQIIEPETSTRDPDFHPSSKANKICYYELPDDFFVTAMDGMASSQAAGMDRLTIRTALKSICFGFLLCHDIQLVHNVTTLIAEDTEQKDINWNILLDSLTTMSESRKSYDEAPLHHHLIKLLDFLTR